MFIFLTWLQRPNLLGFVNIYSFYILYYLLSSHLFQLLFRLQIQIILEFLFLALISQMTPAEDFEKYSISRLQFECKVKSFFSITNSTIKTIIKFRYVGLKNRPLKKKYILRKRHLQLDIFVLKIYKKHTDQMPLLILQRALSLD